MAKETPYGKLIFKDAKGTAWMVDEKDYVTNPKAFVEKYGNISIQMPGENGYEWVNANDAAELTKRGAFYLHSGASPQPQQVQQVRQVQQPQTRQKPRVETPQMPSVSIPTPKMGLNTTPLSGFSPNDFVKPQVEEPSVQTPPQTQGQVQPKPQPKVQPQGQPKPQGQVQGKVPFQPSFQGFQAPPQFGYQPQQEGINVPYAVPGQFPQSPTETAKADNFQNQDLVNLRTSEWRVNKKGETILPDGSRAAINIGGQEGLVVTPNHGFNPQGFWAEQAQKAEDFQDNQWGNYFGYAQQEQDAQRQYREEVMQGNPKAAENYAKNKAERVFNNMWPSATENDRLNAARTLISMEGRGDIDPVTLNLAKQMDAIDRASSELANDINFLNPINNEVQKVLDYAVSRANGAILDNIRQGVNGSSAAYKVGQAVSPEILAENLQNILEQKGSEYIQSNREAIILKAKELGVDPDSLAEKVLGYLFSGAQQMLHNRQVEDLIPQRKSEWLLNAAINGSISGAVSRMALPTSTREMQAEAATRNQMGEGYQPDEVDQAQATGLTLFFDTSQFAFFGGAARWAVGGILPKSYLAKATVKLGMGTVGQRFFAGSLGAALEGSANFSAYNMSNYVMQSLANNTKIETSDLLIEGKHGAISGAVFSAVGKWYANMTSHIGRGISKGFMQKVANTTKRFATNVGGMAVETGSFLLADSLNGMYPDGITLTDTVNTGLTVFWIKALKNPMESYKAIRYYTTPTPEMMKKFSPEVQRELEDVFSTEANSKRWYAKLDEIFKNMNKVDGETTVNSLQEAFRDISDNLSFDAQNALNFVMSGTWCPNRPRMNRVSVNGDMVYEVDADGNVLSQARIPDVTERNTWIRRVYAERDKDDLRKDYLSAQEAYYEHVFGLDEKDPLFVSIADAFIKENKKWHSPREFIADMRNPETETGKKFRQYILDHAVVFKDGKQATEFWDLMQKPVEDMTAEDYAKRRELSQHFKNKIHELGLPAPEISVKEGERVANSNDPQEEQVFQSTVDNANAAMLQWSKDNPEIGQLYNLAKANAQDPSSLEAEISTFLWLRSKGYTAEQLKPLFDFIEAKAAQKGYFDAKKAKVEEQADRIASLITNTNAKLIYTVVDKDGKTWFLKDGDFGLTKDYKIDVNDTAGLVLVDEKGNVRMSDGKDISLVDIKDTEDFRNDFIAKNTPKNPTENIGGGTLEGGTQDGETPQTPETPKPKYQPGTILTDKDGKKWQILQPMNGKDTIAPIGENGAPSIYERMPLDEWEKTYKPEEKPKTIPNSTIVGKIKTMINGFAKFGNKSEQASEGGAQETYTKEETQSFEFNNWKALVESVIANHPENFTSYFPNSKSGRELEAGELKYTDPDTGITYTIIRKTPEYIGGKVKYTLFVDHPDTHENRLNVARDRINKLSGELQELEERAKGLKGKMLEDINNQIESKRGELKKAQQQLMQETLDHFKDETPEEKEAFDKSVEKMADDELLFYMNGQGNRDSATHKSVYDEYDKRHAEDYEKAYQATKSELESKKTSVEDAQAQLEQMKQSLANASHVDKKTLERQIKATEEYIDEKMKAEDEEMRKKTNIGDRFDNSVVVGTTDDGMLIVHDLKSGERTNIRPRELRNKTITTKEDYAKQVEDAYNKSKETQEKFYTTEHGKAASDDWIKKGVEDAEKSIAHLEKEDDLVRDKIAIAKYQAVADVGRAELERREKERKNTPPPPPAKPKKKSRIPKWNPFNVLTKAGKKKSPINGEDVSLRPMNYSIFHTTHNGEKVDVVCDGRFLFYLKSDYPDNLDGKMTNSNGEEVEGNYPKWESVVPKKFSKKVKIDMESLAEFAYNTSVADKRRNYGTSYILLRAEDEHGEFYISINPVEARQMLSAMKVLGTDEISFPVYDKPTIDENGKRRFYNGMVYAESDKGAVFLMTSPATSEMDPNEVPWSFGYKPRSLSPVYDTKTNKPLTKTWLEGWDDGQPLHVGDIITQKNGTKGEVVGFDWHSPDKEPNVYIEWDFNGDKQTVPNSRSAFEKEAKKGKWTITNKDGASNDPLVTAQRIAKEEAERKAKKAAWLKTPIGRLFGFAYGPKTDDGKMRPIMTGVHHDETEGMAVAATGQNVVATKKAYDKTKAGKTVDAEGKEMDGEYPNWKRVLRDMSGKGDAFSIESLKGIANTVAERVKELRRAKVKRSEKGNLVGAADVWVSFYMPDGRVVCFKADQLQGVIEAADLIDADKFSVEAWHHLQMKGKNGHAIFMGIGGNEAYDTFDSVKHEVVPKDERTRIHVDVDKDGNMRIVTREEAAKSPEQRAAENESRSIRQWADDVSELFKKNDKTFEEKAANAKDIRYMAALLREILGKSKVRAGLTLRAFITNKFGMPEKKWMARLESDPEKFFEELEVGKVRDIQDLQSLRNVLAHSHSTIPKDGSEFFKAYNKYVDKLRKEIKADVVPKVKQGKATLDEVEKLYRVLSFGMNNDGISKLADKVFSLLRKLNLDLQFNEHLYDLDGTIVPENVKGHTFGNRVRYLLKHFDPESAESSEFDFNTSTVLLHELIHVGTAYAFRYVENPSFFSKRVLDEIERENPGHLDEIRQAVKNLKDIHATLKANGNGVFTLSKKFKNRAYGITDAEEMASEMANPYFRAMLKQLNLWAKFKDSILKIFGIKEKPQADAENVVAKALDNLLDNFDEKLWDDYNRHTYSVSHKWGEESYIGESTHKAVESIRKGGGHVDIERGDVKMAVADLLNGAERKKAIKELMAVTGRSESTVKKYLREERSLARIILRGDNAAFLNLQADESVPSIWNNSDYPQGTVEFSNICRKRLPFTMIYQKLQQEYPNRVFDAKTLETIRGIMKKNGSDVACGLCFVEDRRQLLGEIGEGFIDMLKGKEPQGSDGKVSQKTNENQLKALAKLRESGDKYMPNLYQLITLDGLKELRKTHPAVAQAFIEYNAARGMQAGRLFEAYSAYHRDILKYSPEKVKRINESGGLRIFSFSDFEAHHLIDLVQVLTDCAQKGIMVQGYTKVPEFAKAVRNTNMKVNRSLIAKGQGWVDENYVPQEGEAVSPFVINGKRLLFDTVEGIDVNHPDFFDSIGSKTVGNILVGINDLHIRMAMLDPFVDYIIPFHSGLSQAIRDMKGIGDWVNYRLTQLEKKMGEKGNLVNADKHGINIYTDVIPKAKELIGREITNARDFQEAYFKACEERGWTPKFSKFIDKDANGNYIYTKGYEKLLIDFKLFDRKGRYIPQVAVVPVFDNELNKRILNDYVKGEKAKLPIDDLYNKVKEGLGLSGAESVEEVEKKEANIHEDATAEEVESSLVKSTIVEEFDEIERLENEPKKRFYRSMLKIGDEYFPPMASKEDTGKRSAMKQASKIGVWEKADEHPEKAYYKETTDKKTGKKEGSWKTKITKDNGESLEVAYNPYFHTSDSMLNDQFASAQDRPHLVTVECEIPESELRGGYQADKALDPVGMKDWKAGTIQSKLTGTRNVILSRWMKIVRHVPDSEAAESIMKQIGKSIDEMPSNVVTPSLRAELEKLGMKFVETDNKGVVQEGPHKGITWTLSWKLKNGVKLDSNEKKRIKEAGIVKKSEESMIDNSESDVITMNDSYMEAAKKGDEKKTEKMVKAAAENAMPESKIINEDGSLMKVYHDTNSTVFINKETGENWDDLDWRKKDEWENRDDWEEHWIEQDFYEFDNTKHGRQSVEIPGFFFHAEPDPHHEYGERRIAAYVDIKNPIFDPDIPNRGVTDTAGRDAMEEWMRQGYDGMIRTNEDGSWREVVPFKPNQIKSADPITYDDKGEIIPLSERFNPDSNDIRHRQDNTLSHLAPVGSSPKSNNRKRTVASAMGKLFGLDIEFIEDSSSLTGEQSRAKGWYDTNTGKVSVVLDKNSGIMETIRTVLHEGVAHHGLRKMFGQHFDSFIHDLYDKLPEATRTAIDDYGKQMGKDRDVSTEEYLAKVAEDMTTPQLLWDIVRANFHNMLRKAGIDIGTGITNGDIRYMLWRSARNLVENKGLDYADIHKYSEQYADARMRRMFGLTEPRVKPVLAEDIVNPSSMSRAEKRMLYSASYNPYGNVATKWQKEVYDSVESFFHQWHEAWVDYLRPLETLQKALTGKMKDSELMDGHNAYRKMRQLSSVVHEKMKIFERNENKDLLDAMKSTMETLMRKNKQGVTMFGKTFASGKVKKAVYDAIGIYAYKKSGLERNRVFFVRDMIDQAKKTDIHSEVDLPDDAKTLHQALRTAAINAGKFTGLSPIQIQDAERALCNQAWHQWVKDEASMLDAERVNLARYYQNGTITLAEMYDQWDSTIKESAKKMHRKYVPGKLNNDRSGIREFHAHDDKTYNDAQCIQDVMDMEAELGKDVVDNLWNSIRKVTNYGIDTEYEGSVISKETADGIKGMMNWYLPMRGFKESTAEDTFSYLTGENRKTPTSIVKKAKGRPSLSDDPFATMLKMANQSIMNAEHNKAKLALLRLADATVDYDNDNRLLSKSRYWWEAMGTDLAGNTIWEQVAPDIDGLTDARDIAAEVNRFNADMLMKQSAGLAKTERGQLDLGLKFTSPNHKSEHAIKVRVNGEDFFLYVNGSPKAAQAINGLLAPKTNNVFEKGLAKVNRGLSAFYTSWSPKFVLRNTLRDLDFATWNLYAKHGAKYMGTFWGCWAKNLMPRWGWDSSTNSIKRVGGMGNLFALYNNGELDTAHNMTHKYFKEFMENGGRTGYVSQNEIESYKAGLDKALTRGDAKNAVMHCIAALPKMLTQFNNHAENMARFAAYETSRRLGIHEDAYGNVSIAKCIADAKDASVDFNRKGAGWQTAQGTKSRDNKKRYINKVIAGGSAQVIRDLYAFVNPAVQSLSILKNNAKEHPVRSAIGMVAHAAMSAAWPAFAAWMISTFFSDEEGTPEADYSNIPEWDRKSGACFYAGKGRWVKVPLGIEPGAAWAMGQLFAAHYLQHDELKSEKNPVLETMSILSALLPVDPIPTGGKTFEDINFSDVILTLSPTSVAPLVQNAYNKKWTGTPIEKDVMPWNKNNPAHTRAFKSTPLAYIELSKWLNSLINKGDTELEKGAFDISPGKMDNLVRGYGGGLGQTLFDVGSILAGEDVTLKNIPVANGLFTLSSGETEQWKVNSKFYGINQQIKDAKELIKKYEDKKEKEGGANPENTARLIDLQKKWDRKIEIWEEAQADIKDIKEEQKDLDPEKDKESLEILEEQQRETMKQAVDDFYLYDDNGNLKRMKPMGSMLGSQLGK